MRKVFLWLGILLLAGLFWYLFIKPYDYLVRFEANALPGTVNQMIKTWSDVSDFEGKVEQQTYTELLQYLEFNDSTHVYQWHISRMNDSTCEVKVYARDTEHSLANKIRIPFVDTDFEKRTRATLIDYLEKLKFHTDHFRVKLLGEEDLPEKFVAYTELNTTQRGKAGGMMKDYNYISGKLLQHEIELDGLPMVDIVHWDRENDSLLFHFCYPIKKIDSLPDLGDIKFKPINSRKALKAEFNGNYIISDRAWYSLMDYAKEQGIELLETPLEVFHNNPNFGGDELKWKAEVYMPLKEESE